MICKMAIDKWWSGYIGTLRTTSNWPLEQEKIIKAILFLHFLSLQGARSIIGMHLQAFGLEMLPRFYKKRVEICLSRVSLQPLLRQCSDPFELIKCSSRPRPIEAVFGACAVALCTTAISKYGGGRRQCCEAVSLSLIAVRVKRMQRILYRPILTTLSRG